jgi:hypothetical protein
LLNLSKSTIIYWYILFREIELRENLVGTGFIDPPLHTSEFNNRVTVMGKYLFIILYVIGEIVSASGFDED